MFNTVLWTKDFSKECEFKLKKALCKSKASKQNMNNCISMVIESVTITLYCNIFDTGVGGRRFIGSTCNMTTIQAKSNQAPAA